MPDSCMRRLAFLVLRAALRLAPIRLEDWARGMLAELDAIPPPWAALRWALGGAGVLMKETAKETMMRNPTLVMATAGLALVLSLGLAPTFREALDASLLPWKVILGRHAAGVEADLAALAAAAEEERDAAAMAFAAARLQDPRAAARLAEQAVAADPDLTWVYYVVAVPNGRSEIADIVRGWAAELQAWDPENAAPHLLRAQMITLEQIVRGEVRPGWRQEDPAWHEAMAAALASPRFDDYLEEQFASDRGVAEERRLPPLLFLEGFHDRRAPTYAASNAARYIDPTGDAFPAVLGIREPAPGRDLDSAVVRYFQARYSPGPPPWASTSSRARMVQTSGLLVIGFGAALAVWMLRRRFSPGLGLAGGGLLLSAALLHLSYRPYAEAFRAALASGDAAQLEALRMFYGLGLLPRALIGYTAPQLQYYFWIAVFILCLATLAFIGLRRLRPRLRPAV